MEIQEKKEVIKELYNNGVGVSEMADRLNLSVSWVHALISRMISAGDMKKRTARSERVLLRDKQVKEMYENGLTIRDMANVLDTSIDTVNGHIKYLVDTNQVERRKRKGTPLEKKEETVVVPAIDIKRNKDGIRCYKAISEKCIYGSCKSSDNKCNFASICRVTKTFYEQEHGDGKPYTTKDCHYFIEGKPIDARKSLNI